MALETRNFTLAGFYVQEVNEYHFYLSKDTRMVIGDGEGRIIIKLQKIAPKIFIWETMNLFVWTV